jgi:hypothetical protein
LPNEEITPAQLPNGFATIVFCRVRLPAKLANPLPRAELSATVPLTTLIVEASPKFAIPPPDELAEPVFPLMVVFAIVSVDLLAPL